MSDLLFARPTFLDGAASVLDLFGSTRIYNVSDTPEEADVLALKSDWIAIGNDLKKAAQLIKNER